jgi:hypothetical protein
VLIFTRSTLLKQLKFVITERTIYQNYMRSRAQGVTTSWKLLPAPCSSVENGHHFAPVLPFNHQPFVLDAKPDGKSTAGIIQVTAKMVLFNSDKHVTVVRVFNRRYALSDSAEEVVASVDPRALVWLWLTRTLEESVRHVLAGLFRATASILAHLPPDSPKAAELLRPEVLRFRERRRPRAFGRSILPLSVPAVADRGMAGILRR